MKQLTPAITGYARMMNPMLLPPTLLPNGLPANQKTIHRFEQSGILPPSAFKTPNTTDEFNTQGIEQQWKEYHTTLNKIPKITLPPQYIYSPQDLIGFLRAEIVTYFDRVRMDERAYGNKDGIQRKKIDDGQMLFINEGNEHEAAYLQILINKGLDVFTVPTFQDHKGMSFNESYDHTVKAMQRGHDVVYQGALRIGKFQGYADFLIKVNNQPGVKSVIGGVECDFHYEAWDTKVNKKEKASHILQLCAYSEMLEAMQGVRPSNIAIALGDNSIAEFKLDDFIYFYHHFKQRFLDYQVNFDKNNLPEIGKGDYSQWQDLVQELLEKFDHLALVASVTRTQIKGLSHVGIITMADLANSELQEAPHVKPDQFHRIQQQAKLQIKSKGLDVPEFEVFDHERIPGEGLHALPPKSEKQQDFFFDFEGLPSARVGSLEYMIGATYYENGERKFKYWWADDFAEEKEIFADFIDWVHARWKNDKTLHGYHYANYEIAAMLRVTAKHGVREDKIAELINAGVFIDQYRIAKQALVVGTPSYSIKYLERLYRDARSGDVSSALASIVEIKQYFDSTDEQERATFKHNNIQYNKDDCDSTEEFDAFLRKQQKQHGIEYQPQEQDAEMRVDLASRFDKSRNIPDKDTPQLIARLNHRYKADIEEGNNKGIIVKALIGTLLFYAREERIGAGDKMRRLNMTSDELELDNDALGNLERIEEEAFKDKRSWIFKYKYNPDQETKLKPGDRAIIQNFPDFSVSIHNIDYLTGQAWLKVSEKKLIELLEQQNGSKPSYQKGELPGFLPQGISLIPNNSVSAQSKHDTLYKTAHRLIQDETIEDIDSVAIPYKFSDRESGQIYQGKEYRLKDHPNVIISIRKIDRNENHAWFKIDKSDLAGLGDHLPKNLELIPIQDGSSDTKVSSNITVKQVHPAITKSLASLILKDGADIKIINPGEMIIKDDVYKIFNEDGTPGEAIQAIQALNQSNLFIQGPPGTGKTTLSAEVILSLILDGKRIAITGPSHKAIDNLFKKVMTLAQDRGHKINAIKIGNMKEKADTAELTELGIQVVSDSGKVFTDFDSNIQLVGTSTFGLANPGAKKTFDYTFTDEAGQVSFADAITINSASQNHVWIGDPKQLPQPVRGTHPGDSGSPVFGRYLEKFNGAAVLPPVEGILLDQTFRMHPDIASFISERFYDKQLKNHPRTQHHLTLKHKDNPDFDLPITSGILYVPVPSEGHTRRNPQEAKAVARIVAGLQQYFLQEVSPEGEIIQRPLQLEDIVVVAPYNSQAHLIRRMAEDYTRVGTVDKFQGQEAHVAITSMTKSYFNSSMDVNFILDPQRLNVALSRAKSIAIFVGSPDLLNIRPTSVKAWKQLNAAAQIMAGAALNTFNDPDSDSDEEPNKDESESL